MKIIGPKFVSDVELPLQLNISFKKVFVMIEKYALTENKNHPFHTSAKEIVQVLKQYPALINGFSDCTLLEKHQEPINLLLDSLFPEALLNNEIKAASVPFSFTSFKFTTRFKNIIKNAGEDYEFTVRNFENESMYIMACTFILGFVYGYNIDIKRPFYFDIPDKTTGTMKYYRATFNADFSEITPTENAPKLTQEDFKELLNNFDNIDIWKEKFPPSSYIFKGFGIINLFDVTSEEMLSSIKANLLGGGDHLIFRLQNNLRDFYSIRDLKLGFSIFDKFNGKLCETVENKSNSIILNNQDHIICSPNYFCQNVIQKVFINHETFVISDLEEYGKSTNKNPFYKNLYNSGIQSIILIPIKANDNGGLALLEIASPRAYDLNSVNINKLKDIVPVFEAAVKRTSEERQNILEATIQENYTSIHPSVKWRFYQAAQKYHLESQTNENAKLDEIVFNDVFPLYGQSDIKGSSEARNKAIREDLITQLTLAISVLKDACKIEKLPIYNELMFRVSTYLKDVKDELNAGDEINILDFLQREIYPVFKHIKNINKTLAKKVNIYMNRLDEDLNVVYEKRKEYEKSVNLINHKLSSFIDKKQKDAQKMFPHYFERYKTDGVEFNMYIGQSIAHDKQFDEIYLYNLRLWQLQTMCEMENIAFSLLDKMQHNLRVASLVLVHSNSMAIKFRMDEKQFDVDGAYNIRYEIIKKRIDKAHIRNSQERITQPGKIAIIYSQDKDALEYIKYINFLQSKNQLGKIEFLELEDLQGVSGLKALRVEVIYQKDFDEKKTITLNDLLKQIEA
ncbi:GAF domain-containing protein [Polaribacter batillariae]|uniref:GAF domain-containing protein n=1 Tax=Polaribacter batillariae TaxID=2808900 RepID=A0ABX7SV75_9FLAO|nr:GAF domain-containing protein [Polaribacter batillariae]QTD36748.1 GAF domain-containing protein [Polaribacter batillariae]